jgi:putative ABC transport system permease protein
MDIVGRDVRYACRGLRRTPGFTAVALATLAIAIGANTAIFSVVDALLVRPLPYRDADRLVTIDATRDYEGTARPLPATFQLDAAKRWQDALHVFDDIGLYADAVFQLTNHDGSEMIDGARVSPSFFSILGGPILAGRALDSADALQPSIVISYRLAQRFFKQASDALGIRLVLNAHDYVIVGVAGPEWNVPSRKTDVWQSVAFEHLINPQCCYVQLLGRLKSEATIAEANGDVRDAARALEHVDPQSFARLHPSAAKLRNRQLGEARPALLMLWAAVAVVLAVACANLLNLLVARNVARARETSIRRALGASQDRLIVQGLTEASLLAAGGVAGGLFVARVAIELLARVDPDTFPQLHDVRIDQVVFAFAVGLGIGTALATGILPAFQAVSTSPVRTVTNAPTRHHRRLQQLLCVGQFGAAVVLLVSATLLGRSFVDLLSTDLGVTPEHVTTATLNLGIGQQHAGVDIATTMQRVIDKVEQVPGVHAVGVGTSLPPDTSRLAMTLRRKGNVADYAASAVSCTPGYFQALGVRLLQGRLFTEADDAQHPPVMIISATTARHLFGEGNPLGETMGIPKFRYKLVNGTEATVIGVVADVKYEGMDAAAGDQVYMPLAQMPWLATFLAVRMDANGSIAPTLRKIVASIDPTVAVSSVKPLDEIVSTATAPARFRTVLAATFALIGIAIASIGLYGIVSYSVWQRTSEIGVRMALGADSGKVIVFVLREAVAIAVAGVVIGIPTAYAASRSLSALLFGVKPTDIFTYVSSTIGIVVIALAASYVPARRAARVDPIIALRAE